MSTFAPRQHHLPGSCDSPGCPGSAPRRETSPICWSRRLGALGGSFVDCVRAHPSPRSCCSRSPPRRPDDSRWSMQVRLLCRIPRPHRRRPCSPAPPLRLAAPPRARPRTRPHIPLERALPAPAVRHAPLPSHPNCRPCSRLSPLSPPILFAPPLAPIPLPSISALSAGRLPSDTYTPQLEFGHSSYVMSSLDWSIYRPGYL